MVCVLDLRCSVGINCCPVRDVRFRMQIVESIELPAHALLHRYSVGGGFTDCYATVLPQAVSHGQFVLAFYTTRLFKLERFLLTYLARRPSTDADAKALAAGEADRFSAWEVEARAENQLLLSDFRQRTRSWLMVQPDGSDTILYFGSAVVPVVTAGNGKPSGMGFMFHALSGFHRVYSVLLLKAAARKLMRLSR